MTGIRILRAVAVGASVALLFTALATPVAAAKPKCMGFKATIVGTNKADVIKGTAKRDVIVAKGGADTILGRGGNDVICGNAGADRIVGQAGHDRISGGGGEDRLFGGGGVDRLFGGTHDDVLSGGAGPDVLSGQVGNDRLDGGVGMDLCQQGTGTGVKVRCELPRAPVVPPGPTLYDLTGTLAIAYSDIDGVPGYSTGDPLIARLLDVDGDGSPSIDDLIVLHKYPTSFTPTSSDFALWTDQSHRVTEVIDETDVYLRVKSAPDAVHRWYAAPGVAENYYEKKGEDVSAVQDSLGANNDQILMHTGSPSRPTGPETLLAPDPADAHFIEVEILY